MLYLLPPLPSLSFSLQAPTDPRPLPSLSRYFAAVEASCELAEKHGVYATYAGSPMSKGIMQPDMWGVTPTSRWDWAALRAKVAAHGQRNSLLLAPMPTASTAQIMGNNESTEPFTSNMYNRRVLAGEFTVVNKYLLKDLVERGLWTPEVRNQIIADRGSVQGVRALPKELKDLYKTVWEIKQKVIIDQAADRGAFICQSQSLNIHMAEVRPSLSLPLSLLFSLFLSHLPCFFSSPPSFVGHHGEAHLDALLLLEARPQDGHVLPAHAPQGRRHPVHR